MNYLNNLKNSAELPVLGLLERVSIGAFVVFSFVLTMG